MLDGRPSVVQRAPLEAIELQSGAGLEELQLRRRTEDRSESWVGKTCESSRHRHTKYVCRRRVDLLRGLAKVTKNGAADSPVLILPLRLLPFIIVLAVRGGHADQIAFSVPAFSLPSAEADVKVQRSGGWSKRRFNHPCA